MINNSFNWNIISIVEILSQWDNKFTFLLNFTFCFDWKQPWQAFDKVIQTIHWKCFPIRSCKSSIFCLRFSYFAILHHNCNLFNTSKPAMLDASLPTQVFPRSDLPRSTWKIWVSTPAKLSDRPHQPAVFIIVQGCTPVPVRPFPWIFGGILSTPSSPSFSPATKKPGPVTSFLPDF